MKRRYLIIGNSYAGVNAAQTIREHDPEGSITILSRESTLAYARPVIENYLLGEWSRKQLFYRDHKFYRRLRLDLQLGKEVVQVDFKKRTVAVDGASYPYDKLLIATGAKPVKVEIKGLPREGCHTFTELGETRKLRSQLNKVDDVLVIGGGFIGLKAAEILRKLGKNVHLVELLEQILPGVVDAKAARLIQKHMDANGVHILTGTTAEHCEVLKDKRYRLALRSGEQLEVDMVLMAIGVRPNVEFLRDSPLDIDKGIRVDTSMRTNVDNVYAAGDCAAVNHLLLGSAMPLPIIPVAVYSGITAGLNMVGQEAEFPGLFNINSLELFGLPFVSAGIVDAQQQGLTEAVRFNRQQGSYRKLVFKGEQLVGYILVGAIDRAGILTNLIKTGYPIASQRTILLADSFGILDLPEAYQREHLKYLQPLDNSL